jgi:hypothetical protein
MASLRERDTWASPERLFELLFGDAPMAAWAGDGLGAPWSSFAICATCLAAGDRPGAEAALRAVLGQPHLQSRHYLQAWHGLRDLGIEPPKATANHLYGVVVELPASEGRDVLAAYEDGTARYLGGAAPIIWDGADGAVEGLSRRLMATASDHARTLPPQPGPRSARPPELARITCLTSGGPRVAEGLPQALRDSRVSGLVLAAADRLTQALVKRAAGRTSPGR